MINGLLNRVRKSYKLKVHQRPELDEDLTFNYNNWLEWVNNYRSVMKDVGSDKWINAVVQHLDYLANPSILKKNEDIMVQLNK